MMSLEQIIYENKKAEDGARTKDIQPIVALTDADTKIRSAPYIGDYKPLGWKQINTYFVDNSGLGSPDKPALTYTEFLLKVKRGRGYAIISAGQFQVYVAEFVRE